MLRPSLTLALGVASLAGIALVADGQSSASLDGTWAGVLRNGSRSAYTTLNISTATDGTKHVDIGNPIGGGSEVLEGNVAARVEGDSVWLPLRRQVGWLQMTGDRLWSRAGPGDGAPLVEFRRVRYLTDNEAAGYEGTYHFADDDSDVVIATAVGRVFFFQTKDGRSARLNPDGTDTFTNGPGGILHVPVERRWTFDRDGAGRAVRLRVTATAGSPRTATRVDTYASEDVSYPSEALSIAGTLRTPRAGGRHAAILLVSGSGPEPRDGFDGTEAFVADWLTRSGYVTLVYDKRGTGRSTGKYIDDNYDSLTTDAIAGLRYLAALPEVDPRRIGVWGMSQGGQLAPIIASRSPLVAFAINTSGSVINSNEAEIQRTQRQLELDGFSREDVQNAAAFQRLKFRYACKRDTWDEYAAAVAKWKKERWFPDPYVGPPSAKEATAWDFWKCGEEPGVYWDHFTKPVLAIYGQNDGLSFTKSQVNRFKQAMAAAHNRHATIHVLPGVGHSMKVQRTGSMADEYTFLRYSLEYFRIMTNWIERIATDKLKPR